MRLHWLIVIVHLFCFGLYGQKTVVPPVAATAEVAYELSADDKDKALHIQLNWDDLEIENQKALLKVEQNKAQQAALMNAFQVIAFNHAQKQKIDLNLFELDSRQLKFVKKGKKP